MSVGMVAASTADAGDFKRWRDRKVAEYPRRAEDLIVEVRDPRQLSSTEKSAIADRIRRANMSVYASACGTDEDRAIPAALGRQFGLRHLDANWLADEDGISSIAVREGAVRGEFIPYTSRPIRWHTDGYYNAPERRIRAFILHCVRPAARGGESALLDHELAWLHLHELNPAWLGALSDAHAMTIPARTSDDGAVGRAAQSGPVFSFDAPGVLQMRYTARGAHVEWAPDSDTRDAVAYLQRWLEETPYALRLRLEPGMGVLCNNVLHAREAFADAPDASRLLYRARYYDRIRCE